MVETTTHTQMMHVEMDDTTHTELLTYLLTYLPVEHPRDIFEVAHLEVGR